MTGTRRKCMISIEQINGEIATLEEEKPTHIVMQKLANLYTVRDHIVINSQPTTPVVSEPIIPDLGSKSEFAELINGKNTKEILKIVDELMVTLQVINPKLYNSVIQRIQMGVN